MLQGLRSRDANKVLASLSETATALLTPHLEPVQLPVRCKLHRHGRLIEYVYFLDSAVAYVVANPGSHHAAAVGLIGREGLVGVDRILGAPRASCDAVVCLAGAARRIPAAAMERALDQIGELRAQMLDFTRAFLTQVMSTAESNARMTLDARLARCLLMLHDRVDGDEIALTHDTLARMLGVRRPGVTVSMGKFERTGIIANHRGAVVIVDREGLAALCGDGYGAHERRALGDAM